MSSATALAPPQPGRKLVLAPRLRLLCGSRESALLSAEDETLWIREPLEAALVETVHRLGDSLAAKTHLAATYANSDLEAAIARLEARRILAPAPAGDLASAAYWDALGVEPAVRNIAFLPLCSTGAELIPRALTANGLKILDSADFLLVTTDDYLRPEIAALANRQQPWLLAKPIGHTIWLGPLFVPGESVCWNCLAIALKSHRAAQASFFGWDANSFPPQPSVAGLPTTVGLAAGLIATVITQWCATAHNDALHNTVLALDTRTLQQSTNSVRPFPDCPACGRFPYVPGEDLSSLLSPITGIASRLQLTEQPYASLFHAQAIFSPPLPKRQMKRLLRSQHTAGKGVTRREAETTAIAEAAERYSLIYRGDEPTFARPPGAPDVLDLPSVLLFSDHQYSTRDSWNTAHSELQWVPERFDPQAQNEWTSVTSLSRPSVTKYVPAAFCYMNHPSAVFCVADTNGCAAGRSREDAILAALLELIERDAVAIWWYNQLERPALSLDERDPAILSFKQTFAALGRDLYVLDVTTDLGIPACVALAPRFDGSQPCFASAAACSHRSAALKAISEVSQICFWTQANSGSEELLSWLRITNSNNYGYLRGQRVSADIEDKPLLCPPLEHCVDSLARAGIEPYFLDLTRREVGVPVVRCIAPGLRHFWRRLAPGRLYDVPVQLGWLSTPRAESELNPVSCMI